MLYVCTMTEVSIIDFWTGKLLAKEIAPLLKACRTELGGDKVDFKVQMVDQPTSVFEVTPDHLIQFCDLVLDGWIKPHDLNTVAFVLLFSEHYTWNGETEDGELVSTVVFDWDGPEVNYPLTKGNVKLWKRFLTSGEYELSNNEIG